MQMNMTSRFLMISTLLFESCLFGSSDENDPFRWLEAVDGKEALDWVIQHNNSTLEFLEKQEGFDAKKQAALKILTSDDRILYGELHGNWVYNFWRSAEQPQGVWRRTSYENYKDGSYEWQVIIDLDALSKEEGINWVWKGVSFLSDSSNRCLIQISDGGKDAMVVREFDLNTSRFIEDGFQIPEAKTEVEWADENAIWLATRFDDNSTTESGYPRILKRMERGQPLENAVFVYEVDKSHIAVAPLRVNDGETEYHLIRDEFTFFEGKYFLIEPNGNILELPIQDSDQLETIIEGQCIVQTRKPWKINGAEFSEGSLLSFSLEDFIKTGELGQVQLVFEPTETVAIKEVSRTRLALMVNFNDNVTNRVTCYSRKNGTWQASDINLPSNGTIDIVDSSDQSSLAFFRYRNFLTPDSLIELDSTDESWHILQSLPNRFDPTGLVVEQHHATSKDGTSIPYFMIHRQDMEKNGKNPTLIYGYGGFEVSMNPFYLNTYGKLWVEPGNVYVLANIRGGGEFGPKWHQAALKLNRQKAYDDFTAIAEDLITNKVTSPQHLGIEGGSNGGLLVGVAFTQHPELYNAVLCEVPLLDMLHYHELPPGASWIGEYGDPRIPEERDYIATYSPYQNLKADTEYPKVFFYTSTRDDRVHPGHARKMAARMEAMGHPFFYFERIEGGHAGGANLSQYAELYALEITYLENRLLP